MRSLRGEVEFVGVVYFTFFVKGAGFSRSYQLTHDTDDNLTMILGATSHFEIFAYHAFVPRYGPATAAAYCRHARRSRSDCQKANGLVYTPLGSENHTRDSIQTQELTK